MCRFTQFYLLSFRMDKLISKTLWMLAGAYIFMSFSVAQSVRPLPANNRRRLPTVIITREHLRQRQNYGTYGDTAAEFVVSAGLDNSKNSAVRIRRIGGRRENVTQDERLNPNRLNIPSNAGGLGHTNIRQDQRYRTPSIPNERNSIPNTYLASAERRYHLNEGGNDKLHQPINRRYHLNENDQRIRPSHVDNFRHTFRNHVANQERSHLQYRPPIFVPNYQQIRRSDAPLGIPGELNRRPRNVILGEAQRRPSLNYNEHPLNEYPVITVKYSTSSVSSSTSTGQQQHRPVPYSVAHRNFKPPVLASSINKPLDDRSNIRVTNQESSYVPRPNIRVSNQDSSYVPQSSNPNTKPPVPSTNNNKQPNDKQNIRGTNQDLSHVPQSSNTSTKPSVPSTNNNKQQTDKQNIRGTNQDLSHVPQSSNTNTKPSVPSTNNNKQQTDKQNIRGTNTRIPFLPQNNTQTQHKEKPITKINSTDHLYINPKNPSIYKQSSEKAEVNPSNQNSRVIYNSTANEESDKTETSTKKENTRKVNEMGEGIKEKVANKTVVPRNPVVEAANPDNNVLSENSPMQYNSVNIREFQTRLIRKPSLILTDQITVNELPRKSDRPRYGPRALADLGEIRSSTRRKRQADSYDYVNDENISDATNSSVSFDDDDDKSEDTITTDSPKYNFSHPTASPQRQGRYNTENFRVKVTPVRHPRAKLPFPAPKKDYPAKDEKPPTETNESRLSPKYYPGEQFSDGTYYQGEEVTPDGIMPFSDFLASPMSEKLRLERQLIFRDPYKNSENGSIGNPRSSNGRYDPRSLKNSTLAYLRKLITARLLHNILTLNNMSANHSKLVPTGRGFDGITSEQRHYGFMMNPYDEMETEDPRSSNQRIRVLRGKIVPLPDLPPEIIPVILGTYKPSYTNEIEEPQYPDDSKLTESMIDNAIFALLQNEGILHGPPVVQKIAIPYKSHRKSPSTNYVGSLKSNEQLSKPSFNYKPRDWPLGPRCDRLTEEICLDDSDYPNSAIMSSIYKDKNRFDLMYAEVKARESQVEGLSRQQETAYSFDHYYGAHPQSSGTSLTAKDYGGSGGFVCPSEVHYGRPHRAKNRKGEWKVVVNVGEYTQTLRMEKCLASGSPCKYVVSRVQSTCSQVYSYHRLLVFNKENGLHIDVFRVPTSCTCHLRPGQNMYSPKLAASSPYLVRPNRYEEFGGHIDTAPSPHSQTEKDSPSSYDKKKNTFGNTLWAILGGGNQASTLAQHPQFLDEVQKQITWAQQLQQYPQLMNQVSPNQVLKQLLDEEDDDYSIRRHRLRQKSKLDQLISGGFASHQVPIAVPLPPPPPLPNGIPRRPVVGISPVDQRQLYTVPPKVPSKLVPFDPSEPPPSVYSLTNGVNVMKRPPLRPNFEMGQRNVYNTMGNPPPGGYKILPGMYPPDSENVQVHESSLLPIAPQFSSDTDSRVKPIMKPMPGPKGSNKSIADEEDLIAAEKSGGDDSSYSAEAVETNSKNNSTEDESKINFSYHPILEYLNL